MNVIQKRIQDVSIHPETTPLYPSSVYTFSSLTAVNEYFAESDSTQFLYRRNGHPNQVPVESWVAKLERAEAATVCSSGMAAISQACFAHLKPGQHVVCTSHLYGGTYAFFEQVLRPWGVNIAYADLGDLSQVDSLVSGATALIYAESIANPLLQVTDLASLGSFAKDRGLKLFVDNTFATPMLVQPLNYGATLTIHSLTKYLNGHSDVLGGVVAGSIEDVKAVQQFAVTFGGTLSPFDAWQTERGLQTFHLRFPVQCENATRLAHALNTNPAVKTVYFPGLLSHPSHDVAKRMLSGNFGAMVSFDTAGGIEDAEKFVRNLQHVRFAPSLGGIHTTISHPGLTSHRAYSANEREMLGIRDSLIRVSVGTEPGDVILNDFTQALSQL